MADQTQFRHITVNAADDDVVMYAGAHTSDQGARGTEEDTSASVICVESVPVENMSDMRRNLQPEKADDYHETTLADIQASKMPAMQKVIIAIAVVAVAAFIVWYVFFH